MNAWGDTAALAFVCLLVLAIGIHGLGNTMMRVGLWWYEHGQSVQNAQDRYGRALATRWVKKLERDTGEGL